MSREEQDALLEDLKSIKHADPVAFVMYVEAVKARHEWKARERREPPTLEPEDIGGDVLYVG